MKSQPQPDPRHQLEGRLRLLEQWKTCLQASVRTQSSPWCEGQSEARRLAGLAATKAQLTDTKQRIEAAKAELSQLEVQAS